MYIFVASRLIMDLNRDFRICNHNFTSGNQAMWHGFYFHLSGFVFPWWVCALKLHSLSQDRIGQIWIWSEKVIVNPCLKAALIVLPERRLRQVGYLAQWAGPINLLILDPLEKRVAFVLRDVIVQRRVLGYFGHLKQEESPDKQCMNQNEGQLPDFFSFLSLTILACFWKKTFFCFVIR